MDRTFFEHVLDAFEGFVDDHGEIRSSRHRRGLKVWFEPAQHPARENPAREHYEAQLIRIDGDAALEIGFHAEHRDVADNQAVLDRLDGAPSWQRALGPDAVAGVFLGADRWRRISEVWEPPDPDAPIEIAARLADYVNAIEPRRRATLTT